jgi:hypothetical protein
MTQYNSASTLSSWLKEIYADSINDLIPEGVRLIKMVQFKSGDKELGGTFHQPVALTHEHGFTVGSGAFSLNSHIAASYADAQVSGVNLLLRTAISYDAAAKASSSKKAFVKWSEQVVTNMTSSFTKRLEVLAFYGGASLGKVSAVSDSSGTNTITITTASWASGIWAGSEGCELDCYSAVTGGSQRNSNATLVISAVDLVNRTVTVTGNSSDTAAIQANDFLFYRGFRGAEMNGLDKIVTNTGSLYNISAATYALWKGNSYSASSGALTMAKIQAAVATGVAKGLDEKVSVFCSPTTYANLNSDLSALRKFDGSYRSGKGESGFESISYFGVNGEIEIIPSIYVKEGEAFCVPVKQLMRIGSSDVTMQMPGQPSDQLVLQLPSNAGYEMRLFTDQNLFAQRPAWITKITSIVNS